MLAAKQATLGDAIRTSPARSTVNCSVGDKPEIAICSLIVPHLTCCQLDLEFHESHDLIFSVKGPRGIHLAGYFVTPAVDHLRLMCVFQQHIQIDQLQNCVSLTIYRFE